MDSNRIKNLATGAREALHAEVSARLDAVLAEGSRERLEAQSQVRSIETDVQEHGRDEVVDRATYTWFNRLCALRFMDANGYMPVPVVTPRAGQTQPAILADARQGVFDPEYEIPLETRRRIVSLLTGLVPSMNAAEDAYSLLLRAVCKRYAGPMGYLFAEHVASSLLMPQGLLAQGSILSRIVGEMDEQACSSVEVLGWLYQFYIAERKDVYFKSKKKATSADIPAATQLFTPEWIVRYLTENSLGRLWMLNNPGSSLSDSMEYYIAPEGDESHIEIASADEIRVLDPACGSGHILVYAFDLLFSMYEEEGWLPEDIPSMILQNNLFGLEIDRRAAEIASFALGMKARERDQRFFEHNVDVNVHVLDPVVLESQELDLAPNLVERKALLDAMAHLDEVGSLYVPDPLDEFVLQNELEHMERNDSLFTESAINKLSAMLVNVRALSQSFHCVIANPPYMGIKKNTIWMVNWLKKYYNDAKTDLCTCFVQRSYSYTYIYGYISMITQQGWLFQYRYTTFRLRLLDEKQVITIADLGAHAFESIGGEIVATCMFTISNNINTDGKNTLFINVSSPKSSSAKNDALLRSIETKSFFSHRMDRFKDLPDAAIAYKATDKIIGAYSGECMGDYASCFQGIITGDVDRYLRFWWEVEKDGIDWNCFDPDKLTTLRGFLPYAKGGGYRRWYGNTEYVIKWMENGKSFTRSRTENRADFLRGGVTWSDFCTGDISVRLFKSGQLFDATGPTALFNTTNSTLYSLGYMNSSTFQVFLDINGRGIHYTNGVILSQPYKCSDTVSNIGKIVNRNINLCRTDWDAFEISWDFVRHPMTYISKGKSELLSNRYARWKSECRNRFNELKSNEEELNRIFARVYHMEDEVPIEVPDDRVSVRLADRVRDARSLISYGVGCMLGRYSTEAEGLVLADQGATLDDFRKKVPDVTFMPDADNVLPVLADEWFDDDVVTGFRVWLAHAFGKETLDENIVWLEESLHRDLRSYLCKEFYADHLKVYQKRPIYWMFQSPKKSFQCLVYMHRYDEGAVGTILTGYLRPLEDKLRARLVVLDMSRASAADVRESNKIRGIITELEQWEREVVYPLAHERVSIDLDDGVKVNYNKFPGALAKVPGLSDWK